jgi:hypothetical protein
LPSRETHLRKSMMGSISCVIACLITQAATW